MIFICRHSHLPLLCITFVYAIAGYSSLSLFFCLRRFWFESEQRIDLFKLSKKKMPIRSDEPLPFILQKVPLLKLSTFQAQFLVEGIGAFIFIMTISLAEMNCGNNAIDGVAHTRNLAPIAIGFILSVVVFSFGYISGGHFNPAITFGVLLIKGIRIEQAVAYWIAQCVGGVIGAAFAVIINGTTRHIPAPQVYKNLPQYVFTAFVAEAVFSCVLVTIVLHVAYSKQKNNGFYGMAIGLCVLSASYAVGGVSGGSFNPAVAFSLQAVKCVTGNCIPLMHLWLYFSAPAAGAVLASVLFKMTHPPPEASEQDRVEKELEKVAGNLY